MKNFLIILIIIFCVILVRAQNENNRTNSSSTSILQSAPISVTIGGDFIITGTYPAMINERVDAFVTRMFNDAREKATGNLTDPLVLGKISDKIKEYSFRNVILKRSSGETIHLDLLKFRLTGDFKNNPYLKNDDVIIFNDVNMEQDFFTVSGAVNKPDKFPFTDGDKLSDAIELAQGISKAYENVKNVTIYRLSYNGEDRNKIIVDINSDYVLQRGDRIIVNADETQRKEFNVTIVGEVKQPGIIPITRDNTTLREAIQDVGGFTESADLRRARLVRGKNLSFILDQEFGLSIEKQSVFFKDYPNTLAFDFEKAKMLRATTMTEKDTAFFTIDEMLRQLLNESSFSFDSVLNEKSAIANLKLRDGDYIIIPQKLNTVYIYGQVVNPGDVNFVSGEDCSYYLKLAGGLGALANKDEIAVIKGATREWIMVKNHSVQIEPGDFIYVPKDPNVSTDYTIGRIGWYISLFASAATILLLVLQFKNG
jgi:protein involved in polysaccharide export with SLBB domain